jgi:hypothetical protein
MRPADLLEPAPRPSAAFDPRLTPYPRDMRGYGRNPPDPQWPGGAAIAVQFVLNYEEGGEYSILHGDAHAESFLAEHLSGPPRMAERHGTVETLFEYGSRVGFWRLWRLFRERRIPVTVFGVAMALARNPEAVAAMHESDWKSPRMGCAGSIIAACRSTKSVATSTKPSHCTPMSAARRRKAGTWGAAAPTH